MSGKLVTGGIALTVLAVVMGVTNPKPAAYSEYASDRMINKGSKLVCEQIKYCDGEKMPTLVKNTVKDTVLKPAINVATKRQNLGLLSVYTTEVPGVGKMQTLGMFGNFFTYSET